MEFHRFLLQIAEICKFFFVSCSMRYSAGNHPSHSIPRKHAGSFFPCSLSFIMGSPKILILGERRKCGNSLEERGFSTCCKPLPTRTSFFHTRTIDIVMWTRHGDYSIFLINSSKLMQTLVKSLYISSGSKLSLSGMRT